MRQGTSGEVKNPPQGYTRVCPYVLYEDASSAPGKSTADADVGRVDEVDHHARLGGHHVGDDLGEHMTARGFPADRD